MKKYIRTIGIDDTAFKREESLKTFVFGVIIRGYNLIEGILRTEIDIDGLDATSKLGEMVISSQFSNQLKAIFLASSTIAAFNIIDLNELYAITKIPVITIMSRLPDKKKVRKALTKLPNWKERYKILENNPPFHKICFSNKIEDEYQMYVQFVGIKNTKKIIMLLEKTTFTSSIPESLRVADLIGRSFKDYMIS